MAFFSEERGRTRAGYSTPMTAVDEFQVNTSNYSSEYGRSAGGVVNTVTKSGTNTIHGETYYYRRNNTIGAANEFTTIQVQSSPGVFSPINFKPTDLRDRWGFGIGGPLMKDKLFWFLAYDGFHHNFPGTAVASNPTNFFATQTVASITITTLATRLGVTPTQALAIYNTDIAGLNTMLGPVPRTGDQDIIFPKLDWQINQKHRFSISVNRMRWWSPAGIQTQATNTNGIASFGNDYVKDTWGVAKFDSFISANLSNQVRFQYGRDFEFENSQTPTPYEQANLLHTALNPAYTNPLGLPPQVSITNGFTFGLPTFLLRPRFPDETRQQIADTVNWIHGKHSLKFGMDFSHVHDNSQNLSTQYGSYSYSSLLNYFTDLNRTNGCGGLACYSSFNQAFGPLGFQFSTNDLAFFAQDDWKIMPRLSLSLGIRYEREYMPAPFANLINPNWAQTGQLPNDKNNLGPRIGFAWDVTGSGKTVLRGGWGIYYGRIINSTIFSALTATGMPGGQTSFSFTPSTVVPVPAPAYPVVFGTQPAGNGRNIVYFDSNFQNPQIRQTDLTLEHDLGWGTVVSASYLGSFGRQLPGFVDTNISLNTVTPTVTYQVLNGGPFAGSTFTSPLYSSTRPNSLFGSMTDITSRTISNYQALVVQVNHRMSHHVQFNSSYTWSHALDNGVNGTTFNSTNAQLDPFNINKDYGNSIYNVPSRFVVNAVVESPWKVGGWARHLANDWQLSPIFQVQSGLPYSASVSGSSPTGLGGINGSNGTNRLDMGRNIFQQPGPWIVDLRLAKNFSLTEKFKMELSTDFFNVANKQNVTGVNTTAYFISSSGTVATPSGNVTCGNGVGVNPLPCLNFNTTGPTPTVGAPFAALFGTKTSSNSNFVYSPRQIQFGLRLKF